MNPFISPAERHAYTRALRALNAAEVPVLIGGAYAMFHYTGVVWATKDLDLFVREQDEPRALEVLEAAGYRTWRKDPLWLSKAHWGDLFIDLIFSSGNGIASVDDRWFDHARGAVVLGLPVSLVPPEEMIWSKSFVQERERWDGADVSHLINACRRDLDWARLMERFEAHWEVLLAHLTLYAFSYPQDRDAVPRWVWQRLLSSAKSLSRPQEPPGGEKVCRGTLLSRTQYSPDIGLRGYRDARELEVPNYQPVEAQTVVRALRFEHADGAGARATEV